MDDRLKNNLVINEEQYYIYGDQAHVLQLWMQTAFKRAMATVEQQAYIISVNGVRTAVEWSYKDVTQSFTSQDFALSLVIHKGLVGMFYVVCVPHRYFKACMGQRIETGGAFNCTPPILQHYINFPDI